MNSRQSGDTQERAALKAGISVRTGRRIEKDQRKEPGERHWRTRQDPFAEVWDSELVPLLEADAGLTGITLWEYLDDQYPGRYPEKYLRTLQRRLKQWRATAGPSKPVIFRQSLPPAHQGLSDFTHPNSMVTLNGKPFKHMFYQFRLAFSGWRYVHIVQGGESYSALADGLQHALFALGGAPLEHRTDSLSAAYVNDAQQRYLTRSYHALCEHYRMKPTVNNLGVSHENGAIEAPHGSLKRRIEQALKLRGNSDFTCINEYRRFIDKIVERLNRRCQGRLVEERPHLQDLPAQKTISYSACTARVTSTSTISVKRGLYTVPSRLIGEQLRLHLYHDRIECFLGQTKVITLRRVYPDKPTGRARNINYQHIIHSLSAKPQAFRFSQLRDDILPNPQYRALWAQAEQQFSPREACKWMVSVLRIACDYDCEDRLVNELLAEAAGQSLPELKQVQMRYVLSKEPPSIPVRQHDLRDYDELLDGQWTEQEAANG